MFENLNEEPETALLIAKAFCRYRMMNNFDDADTTEYNFYDELTPTRQKVLIHLALVLGETLFDLRYLKQMLISKDYEEAAVALECSNILGDKELEKELSMLLVMGYDSSLWDSEDWDGKI